VAAPRSALTGGVSARMPGPAGRTRPLWHADCHDPSRARQAARGCRCDVRRGRWALRPAQ
jgi:hypothetical protein